MSFDLPAKQTGSFELSIDATPIADKIDGFTGISATAPEAAGVVSVIVRFNEKGTIDARNGGAFQADQVLGYSANQVYRVRLVVDVAGKAYSVFVAPAGQPEVLLAKNYAFRTQRAPVQSLTKIVLAGFKSANGDFGGAHRVTRVSLKAAVIP